MHSLGKICQCQQRQTQSFEGEMVFHLCSCCGTAVQLSSVACSLLSVVTSTVLFCRVVSGVDILAVMIHLAASLVAMLYRTMPSQHYRVDWKPQKGVGVTDRGSFSPLALDGEHSHLLQYHL